MPVDFQQKGSYYISDLLRIMEILRGDGGCPWDREQNHQTIRRNLLEETYEAVEAIDTGDMALLREELGDVLLQVIFHSQMEKETGGFTFDDVCNDVCVKLVERHPHIFGDVKADTAKEVLTNWDKIKKQQKGYVSHSAALQGVSRALPALIRSEKVQYRAAKTGFDYPDAAGALADLGSELQELQEAVDSGDSRMIEEEIGDLLFSVVNSARLLYVDSELSLTAACDKFIKRFEKMERLAPKPLEEISLAEMNILWEKVKKI